MKITTQTVKVVAPLAGAWIETADYADKTNYDIVAPLAGAWIETHCFCISTASCMSLPSRERGLKLHILLRDNN